MILRRLTQHIRDQNWFAVGLDFLIVVLGVFIGMQVNSWNAEREARAGERRYLERLREDVAVSIKQNEWRIAFMERQNRYSTLALDRLETCEVPEQDRVSFANAFYHAGKSLPPILLRGVINELNATGNFQTIRNEELRDAITKATEAIETSNLIFSNVLIRANPHVVYVESQLEYHITGARDGSVDIAWDEVAFDLGTLCADKRFRGALSVSRAYTNDMLNNVARTLDQQRELVKMIDAELAP
ncbi:MAG: hypothetical protein ACK4Y9_01990 [Hyphomonas sp.]